MSLASYIGVGGLSSLFTQRPMTTRTRHSIVRRTAKDVNEQLGAFGRAVTENVGKKPPTKLYDQNAHFKSLSDKLARNANPALKELVNRAGNGRNDFTRSFLKKATAAVPKARIEGMGQPEPEPGYTAESIAEDSEAIVFPALAPPPPPPAPAPAPAPSKTPGQTAAEKAAAAEARLAEKEQAKAERAAAKREKAETKKAATAVAKREKSMATALATSTALKAELDAVKAQPASAEKDARVKKLEKSLQTVQARLIKVAAKAVAAPPAAAAPAPEAAAAAVVAAAAPEPAAEAAAPEPAAEAAAPDTSDGLGEEELITADGVESSTEADIKADGEKLVLAVAKAHPLLKDAEVSIDPKTKKVVIYAANMKDGMALAMALGTISHRMPNHPKYAKLIFQLSSRVEVRPSATDIAEREQREKEADERVAAKAAARTSAVGGGGSSAAAAAPTPASAAVKAAVATEKKGVKKG